MAIEDDVAGGETPIWRTTAIADLARHIRENKDLSVCGILADQLEEAGCDDKESLAKLRSWIDKKSDGHRSLLVEVMILTALIAGRETADAVFLIKKSALFSADPSRGCIVEFMIDSALAYREYHDLQISSSWCAGSMDSSVFWPAFDAVMNLETSPTERRSFFRCDCGGDEYEDVDDDI